MARYLLDTDAIIDHLKGFVPTVELIQALHARGELCTCEVVLAEVYGGLHPEDREQAERLLEACTFLPGSPRIAQQAGQWGYRYRRGGITIALTDALVAATAVAHQATVVTRNVADYPMPEIRTLNLPRPSPR
jgi:predicted nucleic acid-binding protein